MRTMLLSLLGASVLGGVVLAQAPAPIPSQIDSGFVLSLVAALLGAGGGAGLGKHMAKEADRKAGAVGLKMDVLAEHFQNERARRERWEGLQEGKMTAWHERAEGIGKNVHATRNEFEKMFGRLENSVEEMKERLSELAADVKARGRE